MGAPAWLGGSFDAALAQAQADGKPLFLYWGAGWCPPCNRQKALLFAQLSTEGVLCYHLDGDAPGAQALAERLRLRSYPTNVMFRADGAELTRLPCEVDAARFASLFARAAAARTTARACFDAALTGTRALTDNEWNLLAWYSWDTDEGVVLNGRDPAASFARLADTCPLPEARQRFAWFLVHAAGGAMDAVIATLDDPAASAVQLDLVLNWTVDLVRRTEPGSEARTVLMNAWLAALERIEADTATPIVDRLQALRNRARLARLGAAIPNLQSTARARVESARLLVTEPALRHATINTAAGVLSDAGLADDAEQVLREELPRSHAPYYFMQNLAGIAKKRGDAAGVVAWYRQAFESAQGTATRIQWGVTYILALLDNTPEAKGELDAALAALRALVAATPDAQSQRNGAQLKKLGARIPLA
jgi:thiol-disulfide isomerase/thioredoxin